MTPEEFCRLAMAEYERQWAAAAGHQERHPLRVKMALLRQLTEEARGAEDFERLLSDACASEDPYRSLLCSELLSWWRQLRHQPTVG